MTIVLRLSHRCPSIVTVVFLTIPTAVRVKSYCESTEKHSSEKEFFCAFFRRINRNFLRPVVTGCESKRIREELGSREKKHFPPFLPLNYPGFFLVVLRLQRTHLSRNGFSTPVEKYLAKEITRSGIDKSFSI